MVDRTEVDAMANIMRKMNGDTSSDLTTPTHETAPAFNPVSDARANTDAMADIMRKLNIGSESAAQSIVTESHNKPDLGVAVQMERHENGVSVSRYDIRMRKEVVQEGLKKTFYSIVDNRSGNVIYDDLGLFETAMGVVKHKLYTQNQQKIDRILELDMAYTGMMVETYGYKQRMKRLDESTVQHDITSAKYSNARTKLSAVKLKLLKAL